MSRRVPPVVLAVVLSLATGLPLGGCASAGSGSAGGSASGPLTSDQLVSLGDNYTDLYELIEDHRPSWLDTRGRLSVMADPDAHIPVVIVDGSERGRLEALRNISVVDVGHVEFLSPSRASGRYGSDYPGGVIEITMRPLD